MKKRLAILLLMAGLMAPSPTRADIPPPPPPPPPPVKVPGTDVAMPETWQVVASGLALSAAIAGLGLVLARGRHVTGPKRAALVAGPTAVGSILTILAGALCFSARADHDRKEADQKAAYAEELKHWRPNGPPPEPPKVEAPI